MTPEMTFECLLVSKDPEIFGTLHRILRDLSIRTRICLTAANASELLMEGRTDLLVIDWGGESCGELLLSADGICAEGRKPIVVAVAADERAIPSSAAILRKPLTQDAGTRCLHSAYSKMVRDLRRQIRVPVMTSSVATDLRQRPLPVKILNLGDGGVGLICSQDLAAGDILSFSVSLPGLRKEVSVEARVLWTQPNATAGCEFVRISHSDLEVMLDWLRSRCQIKKPLIDLDP
ncbi:MAG TPA: PilZ domain-containing protein [Candidatus Sulfotelmatobacter sp.]|jgi:hypothetical protein